MAKAQTTSENPQGEVSQQDTVLEVDCYEEVPCNEKDCAHHRWRDPAPDGGRHSSAPVEAEQKGQIGPGVMPGLSDPT